MASLCMALQASVRLDEVHEAGNFGKNCRCPRVRADAVAVGSHPNHDVPSVGSLTGYGTSRVSHAASNFAVTQTNLKFLSNAGPTAFAVREPPNFGSNRLEALIPKIGFALHSESPAGDVTKLPFVVLPFLWQASGSHGGVVKIDWFGHLQECDVVHVGPPIIAWMDNDFGDSVLDLKWIWVIDVMIPDSDAVRGRIAVFMHAVRSRQNPVLA